jgi:hypothetical protein
MKAATDESLGVQAELFCFHPSRFLPALVGLTQTANDT